MRPSRRAAEFNAQKNRQQKKQRRRRAPTHPADLNPSMADHLGVTAHAPAREQRGRREQRGEREQRETWAEALGEFLGFWGSRWIAGRRRWFPPSKG